MTVTNSVVLVVVIPAVMMVVVIPAVMMILIITIGGNSGTGCATNGTADNRAIPSTNLIAHSGSNGATHTAADGRIQGVVSSDTVEWDGCQNHGDNRCSGFHIVTLQQIRIYGFGP
jgi:hypothetical protein